MLPDTMTIVDEVDSQAKQAMDRYMNVVRSPLFSQGQTQGLLVCPCW